MSATFIRRMMIILLALVVASLALLGYSFFALRTASTNLSVAEANRVRSYQLAMELRQSSDDLTRLARSFVQSHLLDYERQYNTVLDIRNGKTVRPENYHQIYWDLVDPTNPTKPRPDTDQAVPLRTLMEQAGFTPEELALVQESENKSNALAVTEADAMNMVKGRYKDADGNYARLDLPKPEEARQLIYGTQYNTAKAEVMKPLGEFFSMMENRVGASALAAQNAQANAQLLFLALMALSLGLIGALIFFGNKQSKLEIAERAEAQQKAEEENERLNNSVINILQAVNQLSERDLTAKAPVTEDVIGTVSDSINLLSAETAKVLHGVTDIAGQVALVSSNVKVQAEKVAQTAEDERQSVNRMVESLLDATNTMDHVAAMAAMSNESAAQATEV
ncbi:MAG: hypothetical protein Q4G39_02365, partial [Brachymonas sp.]|nr:hypothetical protein [Brachymonas sp.]